MNVWIRESNQLKIVTEMSKNCHNTLSRMEKQASLHSPTISTVITTLTGMLLLVEYLTSVRQMYR